MKHLNKESRDIFDIGFSIYTDHEGLLEQNFNEDYGRNPDRNDWDLINKDLEIIENSALKYLGKTFQSARDEGHDNDSLIGTLFVDRGNRKQMEIIAEAFYNDYEPEPGERGKINVDLDDIGVRDRDLAFPGIYSSDVYIELFR